LLNKQTIFIGIPAFNEEDLEATINSAFDNAFYPENIFVGVGMQYTENNFPDLKKYKNVRFAQIFSEIPFGTSSTRSIACSFYENQDYYLQIDSHTIFNRGWDKKLIDYYNELNAYVEKPLLSGYLPDWHREVETGTVRAMDLSYDFDRYFPCWALEVKSTSQWRKQEEDLFKYFTYEIEAIDSPCIIQHSYENSNFTEHYLISGHFIFTSGEFLLEVPHDTRLPYHEENSTALRAWTRGYRIFSIKESPLWTREMNTRGRDVYNSWRHNVYKNDNNGKTFKEKIVDGTLRNKDILTGKILGIWGAPSIDLLKEYEKASKIDYKKFYENMYNDLKDNNFNYTAANCLYKKDQERSNNG
jgi:hypothetical protein